MSVLRSADCWTDHKLLCAQLKIGAARKRAKAVTRKRFAASGLHDVKVRERFVEKVGDIVESNWDEMASGVEMWEVIRDGMVDAAEITLGWETKNQPDWFKEKGSLLQELIGRRNLLFQRWLRSRQNSDRQRYVLQRREVTKAVKKAKNDWLQEKANEVKVAMLSGGSHRSMWKCLRELQQSRIGLRSMKTRTIKKANGDPCESVEESVSRWQEHFCQVLNVQSSYIEDTVSTVQLMAVGEELGMPPSEDEILAAMSSLKGGKAGGKNGVLPELLKCCGANLLEHLVKLFHQVWRDGCVPQEWKDALIVPIPKKGDLSICDNWRGISLLDVGGKLFAKTIQSRLQDVAEEVLPDSQCGFRRGRGCVDMIFCVRQMIEKAVEHNTKIFMLFIDLRKAYDLVPRQALWRALESYGIPESMLQMIRSLHDGMKAEVTVDGQVAPEFEVRNGLRQGCVLAPTLFNLYFNLVFGQWRERCMEFGVSVLYKCGGKLVGERTRKPFIARVSELQIPDDVAAVGTSRDSMESAALMLDDLLKEWGLTLSTVKTKLLVAGDSDADDIRPLRLDGGEVECVTEFKYLGSIVEAKGGIAQEVGERIAKASKAFGALREPIFRKCDLSLRTKRKVYRAVVLGVLLYGSETWTTKRDTIRRLEVFHNRCLKGILGITAAQQRTEHLSTVQIAEHFGMRESLEDLMTARRLRWLGHVARIDEDRIPKRMLFGWLPQQRPAHGTKMRWRDRARKDLKKFGIEEGSWYKVAQDRGSWRERCHVGLEDATEKRMEDNKMRKRRKAAGLSSEVSSQLGEVTALLFKCDTCQRTFSRRQDIARHRCVTTRSKGQVMSRP